MSGQAAPAQVTARAAQAAENGNVLFKLILFSIALGVVPLGSYFASEKYIFNGNSTYAAVVAIIGANVVLVTYILLSVMDDKREKEAKSGGPAESRKDR
ncbi:hypothetical protein PENSPDRAFT_686547 [Peniophora sp. CONT]|nr:hypothetical protein PENSPDRAFT_686547 [Peniophora sp. CONT]